MTARKAISDAGGLISPDGLARRWGISRQRVLELEKRSPDFPKRLAVEGSPTRGLWLAGECDAWRSNRARNVVQ